MTVALGSGFTLFFCGSRGSGDITILDGARWVNGTGPER
jgi:hypothetical protein